MPLYVVTVDYIMYGVKVDPVCGVFETLEKAQEAINYLLKTYKDTIAYKQFEINEIELNKTYFD